MSALELEPTMLFLEVTLLEKHKTLINASHIVRFWPTLDQHNQQLGTTIALSVPTNSRGGYSLEVRESPEEIVGLLYGLGATFAVDSPT